MFKRFIALMADPFLSLLSFIVGILVFGESSNASVLMFSILTLLIVSGITTAYDYFTAVKEANNICETLRNHVDVAPIGSPELGWKYVIHHLPDLDYVQNTSFNTPKEIEHTDERFYTKDFYRNSFATIAQFIEQGLTWRDVGDENALQRFQELQQENPHPLPRQAQRRKLTLRLQENRS